MGYALYKLSKEDAAIFVKLTEKCWNGKERDLTKLNKYERAVLLKLMDEAGEYKPGEKPVKKANPYHDPKTGRFAPAPGGTASKYPAEQLDKLRGLIESGASFSAIKQRKAMGMSKEEYDEFRNTVKPPKQVEQKPKKARPEAKKPENEAEDSYRMRHRPDKMGSGHDITDAGMMPNDFYDHPEQYATTGDKSYKESIKALQAIRNKPDAEVTIYRAAPKEEFNDGDWVTLSRTYAETHAQSNSRENNQLQVYSKKVRAKDIQFAGDDINEFGYYPVDGVAKSFSAVIRKFNPYHDPKTGRFTSAAGGGGIMANIAPGLKADYDKDMQAYEMLGLDPAPLKEKYELLAVLNPGTKVSIGGMNDEVRRQTVDTVKKVIEKYPMAKDAITSIQVGAEVSPGQEDMDYFNENPTCMAYYNRRTGALCMNPALYNEKGGRSEEFAEIYQNTVDNGFHPKDTDFNSIVVHEMGHAIDNYYSVIEDRNFSAEMKKEISFYMSRTGKPLTVDAVKTGLSEYATYNELEFFAEAFAEYVCSPNPRGIAMKVGQTLDRKVANDKNFKK